MNSLYSTFHLEGYGIVYLKHYVVDVYINFKIFWSSRFKKFFKNKIIFDPNNENDLKLKILGLFNKKIFVNIKRNLNLFKLINKENENKLKKFFN